MGGLRMTNREKLREQIATKLTMDFFVRCLSLPVGANVLDEAWKEADAILAFPNLLVKAEDQSLPQYQFPNIVIGEEILTTVEIQHGMLDAGFVKVEKP